jgi:diguanylate cyclase (GGDEF)-like protein
MALLLIDLDYFKEVNDQCGHQAGDDLLRLFASRLQAPYLAHSFVARLGGDEFVLLITEPDILRRLPETLSQLLSDLQQDVQAPNITIHVSATIGACRLDHDIPDRGEFLSRADMALYRAKANRRGSACIFGCGEIILPGTKVRSDVARG